MKYLATAFSDKNKNIMKYRFDMANFAASVLMEEGEVVFSPISHSYPIAQYVDGHGDHNFWLRQDKPFLKNCDEIIIIKDTLGAWQDSKGVQEELQYAKQLGIPHSVRRF